MIVAACGTVSSVAGKKLESDLPVPYTGVINPTAFATAKRQNRQNRRYSHSRYNKHT